MGNEIDVSNAQSKRALHIDTSPKYFFRFDPKSRIGIFKAKY